MKKTITITVYIYISLVFSSCLKSDSIYKPQFLPLSSFTLVNATTDVTNAKAYAAQQEIPWISLPTTEAAAQYRFTHLGAYEGSNYIRAVSALDTTRILFASVKQENFIPGEMNMLFLCGNTTAGYEGLLMNHESPKNYTDSTIGIRFINLSPNSLPVNITLSTGTGNEATNLEYKKHTEFKQYTATGDVSSLMFQVRDASSNALLASYTLPAKPASPYTTVSLAHARFKSLTLVIKGLTGTTSGTNALGIFPVAHY